MRWLTSNLISTNIYYNSTNTLLLFSFILLIGTEVNAKIYDAQIKEVVGWFNEVSPKVTPDGTRRLDKASFYKGTICFHNTSLISGTQKELKRIFWADILTRSKLPNMAKIIADRGAIFYEFKTTKGEFLFMLKVTRSDLLGL